MSSKKSGISALLKKPEKPIYGLGLQNQLREVKCAYRKLWDALFSGKKTAKYAELLSDYKRVVASGDLSVVENALTQVVYVDMFTVDYHDGGKAVGFIVHDELSAHPMETYDEWQTEESFLASFPTTDSLDEFIHKETCYRDILLLGVPLRLRGDRLWVASER